MSNRHTQTCAIAGALNVIGDRWTLLLVREAFFGTTRFSEFQRKTGIAKTMLSDRLAFLEDEGVFRREEVGERGTRYAYHLTEKGRALGTTMIALMQWSSEHVFGKGREPMFAIDRDTEKPVAPVAIRSSAGRDLHMEDLLFRPGPGASAEMRERMLRDD